MAPHLTSLLHFAAPIIVSFYPAGGLSYRSPVYRPQVIGRSDISLKYDLFKRAGPTCPADDGNTFSSTDTTTYKLACGSEVAGNTLALTDTTSILACADFCSKYNEDNDGGCGAFSYVEGNKGLCTLVPAGGNVTKTTGTDVGTLVEAVDPEPSESDPPFAPSCPDSDMVFYTNTGGDLYEIRCSQRATAGTIAFTTGVDLSGCMSFCSKYNTDNGNGSCVAATHQENNGGCSLVGTTGASGATGFSYLVLTTDFPNCAVNNEVTYYQGKTDGRLFQMHCGVTCGSGYVALVVENEPNEIACLDACDARPDCVAISYQTNTTGCILAGLGGAGSKYTFVSYEGRDSYGTNQTSSVSTSTISSTSSPTSSSAYLTSSSSTAVSSSTITSVSNSSVISSSSSSSARLSSTIVSVSTITPVPTSSSHSLSSSSTRGPSSSSIPGLSSTEEAAPSRIEETISDSS